MRYTLTISTLLAVIVACTEQPRAASSTATDSGASVREPANAPAPAASVVSADRLDSDAECGLLEVRINPDPVALVRRYVALDDDGRFLETTAVADSMYACPRQLPGPDEFTVVRRSTVEPTSMTDSVARVVVRSERVGRMTQDSLGLVFVREPGVVVDTFVVVRTPFGWRIESPQLPDRVLASAVLARPERFPLRDVVRDSLEAAAPLP